ncbi:MAG TPA: radical SAM protein, partial [Desulfobacteraceae bacterium]|nr:radical SAM protein [Desulfobacteraceae bacterium]
MRGKITALYRSRLAAERGFIKKDWGGKRLTVALAYPNTYAVGMSSLGFQVVYGLFNQRPDVVAERVFLPEGQEMSLYLQSGEPLLSLESQRPVHDFDILAFSVSFENDYP